MTKQEKIREGIAEIVRDCGIRRFQKEKPYAMHELLTDCADAVLSYLHSQGVVIKVEGELPIEAIIQALDNDISDRRGLKWEWDKIDDEVMAKLKSEWATIFQRLLTGYKAVEPLIKVANDTT